MDPHENNNTRAQYMHGLDTHSLIWVEIHSNEKCPSLKRHVTHPPLSLLIVDTMESLLSMGNIAAISMERL